MSPNAGRREPETASLCEVDVSNLSYRMKSITCDEGMSKSSRKTSRGGRGERASKEWSRYLGDPLRYGVPAEVFTGNNNRRDCCKRESERPVVVKKFGKPNGAKGPCLIQVKSEEGRTA